jgi:hypothetical protein
VSVYHGDACEADLSDCTVIFMYLCYTLDDRLIERLQQAHNRGVKIVSNMFSVKCLGEPSKILPYNNGVISLKYYHNPSVPASASAMVDDAKSDDKASKSTDEKTDNKAIVSTAATTDNTIKAIRSTDVKTDNKTIKSTTNDIPERVSPAARATPNDTEPELTELEKLENWLDPLQNPRLLQVFDLSMVGLLCILCAVIATGVNVSMHVYIMSALTIGLFLSVRYFATLLVDIGADSKGSSPHAGTSSLGDNSNKKIQ